MKKIIIYLCFMGLLSFFSCNDYLEVKPKNSVYLENIDDIKGVMSSYFYGIQKYSSTSLNVDDKSVLFPYYQGVMANFGFYSDNIDMTKMPSFRYTWSYFRDEYYEAVDWNSRIVSKGMWDEFYSNIGIFNLVLDVLNKLDDKSTKEYTEVYCEAKILRTLMFFEILKFFTPYDNDEYGIPVETSSNAIEPTIRLTQKETFAFLLKELESIRELDFNPTSWNIFYSKEIVSALMAQIYLYKAESPAKEINDWQNALDNAKAAMQGRNLANNSSDLKAVFGLKSYGFEKNSNHALLIFGNRRYAANNIAAPFGFSGGMPTNPDFIALYDADDIRKSAFFTSSDKVYKHRISYSGAWNTVPFWRIAELHLIVTEAYARIGDNDNAKKYLENFKKTRIPSYTTYSGSDLLGDILKERRKELCFEHGARWIDLKRTNTGFTRTAISPVNDEIEEFVLEESDYRFALPIPLDSEMIPNNKIKQNPGWIIK